MSHKLKFGDLTKGEWRSVRRRREGLTQSEAAYKRHISRIKVVREEQDKEPLGADRLLAIHERAVLLRDRAKLTQAGVAAKLGLSTFWVREMELGRQPCIKLLNLLGEEWPDKPKKSK